MSKPSLADCIHLKFSEKIVEWFQLNGRKNLPWQAQKGQKVSPYHVWLSEIMLQQTQVIKVMDYFDRFITALPTLKDLADADEQLVLSLWSGLGYYNRAKNLHKSAKLCQLKYNNKLPGDLGQLIELPGIGRSTAAAIMSLAFNQAEPIMDGNVKRVFSRHFLVSGEPNKSSTLKQLWLLAEEHREQNNPAAYTQGLMDLGATVCTKHKPKCDQCPLNQTCSAKSQGVIAAYPEKKRKVKQKEVDMYCLLSVKNNQVALAPRGNGGIWPDLWFLPTFESEKLLKRTDTSAKVQFSLTHKLTHRILHLHIYTIGQAIQLNDWVWVERKSLTDKPHPKALIHILEQHDNH